MACSIYSKNIVRTEVDNEKRQTLGSSTVTITELYSMYVQKKLSSMMEL